jgi:hypothetical protein
MMTLHFLQQGSAIHNLYARVCDEGVIFFALQLLENSWPVVDESHFPLKAHVTQGPAQRIEHKLFIIDKEQSLPH